VGSFLLGGWESLLCTYVDVANTSVSYDIGTKLTSLNSLLKALVSKDLKLEYLSMISWMSLVLESKRHLRSVFSEWRIFSWVLKAVLRFSIW
jgi:hypothetical protein